MVPANTEHKRTLRLVKFIVQSIKDSSPKKGIDEVVEAYISDTADYENLQQKYAFLREAKTSSSSYFRSKFLLMLKSFYSMFVLIHKEKRAGVGLNNPRLIIPENDPRFPPWQDNSIYADAYDDLYQEITNFLSASVLILLFEGAQRVVLARDGVTRKCLMEFPSKSGMLFYFD